MVLGSAIVAFNEVCPQDYTLIHPCYRKLCHLLADIDEWSQVNTTTIISSSIHIQHERFMLYR
jgi:AP-3 complex subunit beta